LRKCSCARLEGNPVHPAFMEVAVKRWNRLIVLGMLTLVAGCAGPLRSIGPDPQLARYETLSLTPVTFSTHQALSNERENIAKVLQAELADALRRRGYAVVADSDAAAGARLAIDITSLWDDRLYGREGNLMERLYPEVEIYAEVTLTDRADGAVVLHREVRGVGPIEPFWSPAPEAVYTAPQRDLAQRIAQLFPSR